jgi:hypothetical protein
MNETEGKKTTIRRYLIAYCGAASKTKKKPFFFICRQAVSLLVGGAHILYYQHLGEVDYMSYFIIFQLFLVAGVEVFTRL